MIYSNWCVVLSSNKSISSSRLVALIFIINLLICGLSFGQEAPIEDSESDSMDVVYSFPAKMSTHSTWEKVVSFPGTVTYLPFRLFFGGVRATVRFAQEAPSLAPLRELFVPRVRIEGILPTASCRSGAGLKYYRKNLLGQGSRVMINFKHGFIDRRQKITLSSAIFRSARASLHISKSNTGI